MAIHMDHQELRDALNTAILCPEHNKKLLYCNIFTVQTRWEGSVPKLFDILLGKTVHNNRTESLLNIPLKQKLPILKGRNKNHELKR